MYDISVQINGDQYFSQPTIQPENNVDSIVDSGNIVSRAFPHFVKIKPISRMNSPPPDKIESNITVFLCTDFWNGEGVIRVF